MSSGLSGPDREARLENGASKKATSKFDQKVEMRRPRKLKILIGGVFLCICFFILTVRHLSSLDDEETLQYGIVFDAGSTGTRIHVYRFLRSSQSLHLKDELFEEVKPGLSSYASEVRKAGESLLPLLEKAKNFIPQEQWNHVPLSLYATAGLRLVSDEAAQALLEEVKATFSNSPFQVCETCVRILDGLEEGTFAWYGINYLLGLTRLDSAHQTVGAIDLGGGSVQITFLARQKPSDDTPKEYLHETKSFGDQSLTIYSHSYLGLGLNAARFELLAMTTSDADLHLPRGANGKPRRLTDVDPDASVTYTSPCLPETYVGTWRYQSIDVHAKGFATGLDRFAACYALAKRLVTTDFDVHHPDEVHRIIFYIQSFFLDRAVDAGIIGKSVAQVFRVYFRLFTVSFFVQTRRLAAQ